MTQKPQKKGPHNGVKVHDRNGVRKTPITVKRMKGRIRALLRIMKPREINITATEPLSLNTEGSEKEENG